MPPNATRVIVACESEKLFKRCRTQQKWQEVRANYEKLRYRGGSRNVKVGLATYTGNLIRELIEAQFVNRLSFEERQLCMNDILPYVHDFQEGERPYMEQVALFYFNQFHAAAGHVVTGIDFHNKNAGSQSGCICVVSDSEGKEYRYFMKTHQYGPTGSVPRSVRGPDVKEFFVYKLMEIIGIGPAAHFMVPVDKKRKTVYIATDSVDLVLVSVPLTGKLLDIQALNEIDLISRILCLSDCPTNSSNCGQVDGKAVIIDFRIDTQYSYFKPDIVQRFFEGNGEFNYSAVPQMHRAVSIPPDQKETIMRAALEKWDLMNGIDKAFVEISTFMTTVKHVDVYNDLDRYVKEIKQTIQILKSAVDDPNSVNE